MIKTNLKKIIATTLISGLVSIVSAQEKEYIPPKLDSDKIIYLKASSISGMYCLQMGYDEDGDKQEDIRLRYFGKLRPDGVMELLLSDYCVDLDNNGYFSEDEIFTVKDETNNN